MTTLTRRTTLAGIAAIPAAAALGNVPAAQSAPRPFKFGVGEGPRSFGVQVLTDLYEPEFPKGSIAIIDPDLAPKDDDLVLVKLDWVFFPVSMCLLPYTKRAGHAVNGRFCRPGDPDEVVALIGPIAYTRETFGKHVEILGTATGCCVRYAERAG